MSRLHICRLLILGAILFASSSINAAWHLNNEASRLSFVSIKKSQVAEVHKFTHLSGTVDKAGEVNIVIQLASVDTAVPIRDERMREVLFNTDLFPKALVTGKIDPTKFMHLETGQVYQDEVAITLTMHGHSKTIKAEIDVVKLHNDGLMVASKSPVIVNAEDFGLTDGVVELASIAKLPAISSAVPVTLNFVLDKGK